MASELASTTVHPLSTVSMTGNASALEGFSFQDLSDSDDSDDSGDDGRGNSGERAEERGEGKGDGSSEEDEEVEWEKKVPAGWLLGESEREDLYEELKEHGLFAFLKKYVATEVPVMPLRQLLLQFGVYVPEDHSISDFQLIHLIKVSASRVLRNRKKLPNVNTPDDVVRLIHESRNIVVLTGAGVSTSCGIPDFRSADGLYAQLREEGYEELDDPQQMFDIEFFRKDPRIFFSFAKHIFPSNFEPSPGHRFVKLLEHREKLLRNYTQNIDTLETQAGVVNALQCHGSFATATCLKCSTSFPGSTVKDDVLAGRVALCPICPTEELMEPKQKKKKGKAKRNEWDDDESEEEEKSEWESKAIVKPDITFFGEKLSSVFDESLLSDRSQIDLLLVLGTSLKVAPVSEILSHIPHRIPQVLINRDPVTHFMFDVCLLGDGDGIVEELCRRLEETDVDRGRWDLDAMKTFELPRTGEVTKNPTKVLTPQGRQEGERVGNSHAWLFDGAATAHPWVAQMQKMTSSDDGQEEGKLQKGAESDMERLQVPLPSSRERSGSREREEDDWEEEPERKRSKPSPMAS